MIIGLYCKPLSLQLLLHIEKPIMTNNNLYILNISNLKLIINNYLFNNLYFIWYIFSSGLNHESGVFLTGVELTRVKPYVCPTSLLYTQFVFPLNITN